VLVPVSFRACLKEARIHWISWRICVMQWSSLLRRFVRFSPFSTAAFRWWTEDRDPHSMKRSARL
jgi:hypothetical protein